MAVPMVQVSGFRFQVSGHSPPRRPPLHLPHAQLAELVQQQPDWRYWQRTFPRKAAELLQKVRVPCMKPS